MNNGKGNALPEPRSPSDVERVRIVLIGLIETMEKDPKFRKDPVIQALMHKLCELTQKDYGTDQSFKTVGVVMNALRSAGTFNNNSSSNPNAGDKTSGNPRPEPKSKARSTTAETPVKATEKGQKMRGLDRGIDFLFEFGYLDENDIKAFRALRADPDELNEFSKSGEKFQRRVKDTGDWDLLYTKDSAAYTNWMRIADRMVSDFKDSKGAFEPEMLAARIESAVAIDANGQWATPDDQGLRSVLKGPPLDQAISFAKKKSYTPLGLKEILYNEVIKQRWFKFGKSPTLD
jgi:hypothetical protein